MSHVGVLNPCASKSCACDFLFFEAAYQVWCCFENTVPLIPLMHLSLISMWQWTTDYHISFCSQGVKMIQLWRNFLFVSRKYFSSVTCIIYPGLTIAWYMDLCKYLKKSCVGTQQRNKLHETKGRMRTQSLESLTEPEPLNLQRHCLPQTFLCDYSMLLFA